MREDKMDLDTLVSITQGEPVPSTFKLPLLISTLSNAVSEVKHYEIKGTGWSEGSRARLCNACDKPLIKDDSIKCSIHHYRATIRFSDGKEVPYSFEVYCDDCHTAIKEKVNLKDSE